LPDRKRDLERILRRLLQSQPFSGVDIKPPISAALTGTGNSSVFRDAVLHTGYSYLSAECGLGLRERIKRPEIGRMNGWNQGRQQAFRSPS
jgi:hypothetical protein